VLCLFGAAYCRTLASILGNDLADRAEDSAAGKDRWILDVPPAVGIGVVAGLACLGTLIVGLASSDSATVVAYVAAVALGLAYSVRPIRFKERGLLGLVTYSLSGALAYAAVPWLWLGGEAGLGAVLAGAVFLDKWVNLHFHLVVDYEADRERGGGSYNVVVGLARTRRTLQLASILASIALLAALGGLGRQQPVLSILGLALAAAVGAYARVARSRKGASTLVRELPCHYLALAYVLFWTMPPILLARLAFDAPMLWIPTALAACLLLLQTSHVAQYRYQ
jgi:hypothetical protein